MAERRAHLFEQLCLPATLDRAWSDVLAHYQKDRIPQELRVFDRQRGREIQHISEELRAHTFLPEPASLIYIPKPNHPGERRPIALVRPDDRIVLTALNRLLAPLLERRFLQHSYAYRPGRGGWPAIERVATCLHQGLTQIAAGDIDDFFASIDRDLLLRSIKHVVFEQPVLDLLETYLHIGTAREYEWTDNGRGLAQGSPLSPVLSNLALCDFDRFLEQLAVEWVRYADNYILLGQEPSVVRDAFERAEAFLLEHCGLRLNASSRLFCSEEEQGFEFLGFWFHNGRRTISPRKLDLQRLRIAEHLRQNPSNTVEMVRGMSETIQGWRAYYGKSPDTREQLAMLEQHLGELLVPWLAKLRSLEQGKLLSAA